LIEAKNIFLDPDIVHSLRNPIECLGEAKMSCDIVELEKQWLKFTKYMLQLEGGNVQKIRYENPQSGVCALCSRLSIPVPTLSGDDPSVAERVYEGSLQSDTRAVAWRLGYKLTSHDTSNFLFIDPDAIQGSLIWLRKGDKSKPVFVILHGVLGTKVAAQLEPYLPSDASIISLQAPDLIKDFKVKNIKERAMSYLKILVAEWDDHNPTMHLLGYSLSGTLAFELALCTK